MSKALGFVIIATAIAVSAAYNPKCRSDPKALNYRGTLSTTVSGRTCQKWTVTSPHKHMVTPGRYPNAGLGDHNYCRNPGRKSYTAWCYTTDSKKRWEFCRVGRLATDCTTTAGFPIEFDPKPREGFKPRCMNDLKGYSYRGTKSVTLSGRRCQNWNSLSPHRHRYSRAFSSRGIGRHNYCRNPDGSNGAWCYTTDPKVRREYCAIGRYAIGCYTRRGELRLAGTDSDIHQGRLEYWTYKWSTINGPRFPMTSGNVACRQLGFPQGALNVYPNALRFGFGSGRIELANVECKGYEAFISQCPDQRLPVLLHQFDVGVECKGSYESVRLAHSGRSEISMRVGRVEVKHNEKWGTVCNDGFGWADAHAICRTLGYHQGAYKYGTTRNPGVGYIWLADLRCTGIEDSISECRSGIPLGSYPGCDHSEDVYVFCRMPRGFKSDLVPLGMESKLIPDSSITASSSYSSWHAPPRARLNTVKEGQKRGAWSAKTFDKNQWIQVDLKTPHRLIAVATQGRQDMKHAVLNYKVACSLDGVSFGNIKAIRSSRDKIFKFKLKGVVTQKSYDNIVTNFLPTPRVCRYVRLLPQTWQKYISLRFELYGDSNITAVKTREESNFDETYDLIEKEFADDEELAERLEDLLFEAEDRQNDMDEVMENFEREFEFDEEFDEDFDEKNENLYMEDMGEREEDGETQEEEREGDMNEERGLTEMTDDKSPEEKELTSDLRELLELLNSK